MFQNSYQNGTYLEIFDPKTPPEKMKELYKIVQQNANQINKIFDKELKTYIFEFHNQFSKIIFPRQEKKDLYLIQQYLVIQVYIIEAKNWHLQLIINDLNKTKRRVILSNSINKIQKKPFFIKYPYGNIQENTWITFTIDLHSFIDAFKDQTYRSLDAIQIIGHFKLKRIFTTQNMPSQNAHEDSEIDFLPKNYYFSKNIDHCYHLVKYDDQKILEQIYHKPQVSSKVFQRSTNKRNISTPKTEITKIAKRERSSDSREYIKQKKFLSNTNGPEAMKRISKVESDTQSFQTSYYGANDTPSEKGKRIPPLKKSSKSFHEVQKSHSKLRDKKQKINSKEIKKINPWKSTHTKQSHTDKESISSKSRVISTNKQQIHSAKTTMFKGKNNLVQKAKQSKTNKNFDLKSDYCSDSEYAERSQKFSTLSDGKFHNNVLPSQSIHKDFQQSHQQPYEIEQNIEFEFNEMQQSIKREENKQKNEQDSLSPMKKAKEKQVQQIVDSLQNMVKNPEIISSMAVKKGMNTSLYGFGEKIMKKIMDQVERPYSPPMDQRSVTDEISQRNQEQQVQKEGVELMYDPVLNCYYDHKTHTYYELKN